MCRNCFTTIGMKFPIKLQKLIAGRGWNKSQVARKVGVRPTTMTRWTKEEEEQGKRAGTKPKLDQLLKLSRIFDVAMEYLADDALGEAELATLERERQIVVLARRVGLEKAEARLLMVDETSRDADTGLAVTPKVRVEGDGLADDAFDPPASVPAPAGSEARKRAR